MAEAMLRLRGVRALAAGKEILHDLDLDIEPGTVHVLMGPNGAGKSTLAGAIMGDPRFEVHGEARFLGEDIFALAPDARARLGLFLSFQTPQEIPGISLENFLRAARGAIEQKPVRIMAFRRELEQAMQDLEMDAAYAQRHLNVGFSGGEKKKAEILQLLMLKPKLAILDETDSGLDVDAVKTVSRGVKNHCEAGGALLIITHNARLLEALSVDRVHVLAGGRIAHSGGPELIARIQQEGFAAFVEEAGA